MAGQGRKKLEDLDWDAVSRRAYEIYEERMALGLPGDEISDWLRAEAEILSGSNAEDST